MNGGGIVRGVLLLACVGAWFALVADMIATFNDRVSWSVLETVGVVLALVAVTGFFFAVAVNLARIGGRR